MERRGRDTLWLLGAAKTQKIISRKREGRTKSHQRGDSAYEFTGTGTVSRRNMTRINFTTAPLWYEKV